MSLVLKIVQPSYCQSVERIETKKRPSSDEEKAPSQVCTDLNVTAAIKVLHELGLRLDQPFQIDTCLTKSGISEDLPIGNFAVKLRDTGLLSNIFLSIYPWKTLSLDNLSQLHFSKLSSDQCFNVMMPLAITSMWTPFVMKTTKNQLAQYHRYIIAKLCAEKDAQWWPRIFGILI